MSVQAGIWILNGDSIHPNSLDRVSKAVAEFGPDGEFTYMDGPVVMLYRPFHTTVESRAERQPYVSARGKVITWDGRLDNRDELLAQLHNELAGDQTDVAIFAAAFEKWGSGSFAKLIGDWALSVWDQRERELTLSRDYIGVRHLYYRSEPRRIIWCNHLAPLVLNGDQVTLCDEYIAGYLASVPDAYLTPYSEVHSVPPGQFVRIHGGKTSIHAYWSFNTRLRTRYKTDAEYEEEYRHLLRQAVRRRLRCDSPILADLSGGLDSSSIVCIADDILGKEGAETPAVDTFSFYDSNEPDDDDLRHFTRVEAKRGRMGFHADLQSSGDTIPFQYPHFVARPGLRNRPEVESAMAAILEQRKYRVTLSGTGGDDVNGQGLDPCVHMANLLFEFHFKELVKQLTAWSLFRRRQPWIYLFSQTLLKVMPLSLRSHLTEQGKVDPWIDQRFARHYKVSARQVEAGKVGWPVSPSVENALQIILSFSRAMTCTEPTVIETRYPYLDQNLVEFVTTVPLDQLLRPGQRRVLMRRALAGMLPPEILNRKTKAIANRCYFLALEKHWDTVRSIFGSPLSSRLGYIDAPRIREALLAMKNGRSPDYMGRLLRAIALEVWLRDVEARGVISLARPVAPVARMTGAIEGIFRSPRRHEPNLEQDIADFTASRVVDSLKKGGEHNELQQT